MRIRLAPSFEGVERNPVASLAAILRSNGRQVPQAVTPGEFAAKWQSVTTSERAAAHEHFIDLCRLLGERTPNEADPAGTWYAFEKGAEKLGGDDGFADVWKRGFFALEYKGKKKDKKAAYLQLQGYRDALENPPLLVVWTSTRSRSTRTSPTSRP